MKGILLAGGTGTRLGPLTLVVNKHLLPIYDKPMIFYPLSVLMLAGIREILLISTPRDLPLFRELLGDGNSLGIRMAYAAQTEPRGLADAFIVGRDFVGTDRVALALGDNLFLGEGLKPYLEQAIEQAEGATVFTSEVDDPERFGIVTMGLDGKPASIEEKPVDSQSRQAVTGLYFYDNNVLEIAAQLNPSARGELEITDINRVYLERGMLQVQALGPEITWLDAGTPEALLKAGNAVCNCNHSCKTAGATV